MLSFVFLSQPLPSTVSSPASFLSLFSNSTTSSLDNQPISLLLHILRRLLSFSRDNTVVVFLFFLVTSTILWLLGFNLLISPASLKSFFRFTLGVSSVRTKRAVSELKRKSFHLLGLLIPVIYYMGSKYTVWLNQTRAVLIMCLCTAVVWLVEALRLWWPAFRRGYGRTFAPLLRKAELSEDNVRLTATPYFFLGNLLCIFLFEPTIATCASLYLVLGDMTAAIIGISFGRLKLPSGKSVEGSVAMWLVCLLVGTVVFWHVHLSEYIVIVGATVATLSELMLAEYVDDNLCIPLCSALALHLSFQRIGQNPPLP